MVLLYKLLQLLEVRTIKVLGCVAIINEGASDINLIAITPAFGVHLLGFYREV
jgi:hypothetical protein